MTVAGVLVRGGGGGSKMIGDLVGVGVTRGGGGGSQMIGLRGGMGVAVRGGGAGSQITGGQQRVVAAPPDMTINAKMVFCESFDNLCQGIIATSIFRRMKTAHP